MDGAIQQAPQPTRQSMLFFRQDFLDDLFEYRIGLCPNYQVPIGEDERGHSGEPIFSGQVDIGGYLRVEGQVGQYIIEVSGVQADLIRDLFEHRFIIDRAGLLPICLHDGFMEFLSLSLRFGILFSDQRGAAVDAKWAGVHVQAILFACPLFQEWP